MSKNLEVSYKRVVYQIESKRPSYALRHQRVWVYENAQGEVEIEYKGKKLAYRIHRCQPRQGEVADSKQIQAVKEKKGDIGAKKKYVPAADHAWRRFKLAGSLPPKPIEQR